MPKDQQKVIPFPVSISQLEVEEEERHVLEPEDFRVEERRHAPDVVRLDYRVAVYVPFPEAVEEVAQALAQAHGGATVQPGHGYWVNELGQLERDETSVVYAFTADPDLDQLLHLAGLWAVQWSQESVAVECDGALYLVPSARAVANS